MQILVLLAFAIAMTAMTAFPPLAAARWVVAPALAGYFAVAAGIAWLSAALSARALGASPDLPRAVFRTHTLLMALEQFWLLGGLAGVILLGYGRWLDDQGLWRVPLASEAMAILPFFAALLLLWLLDYPFYAEVRRRVAQSQLAAGQTPGPVWTRGEYIAYSVRHNVLFIAVPVGLILLVTDAMRLWIGPLLPADIASYVLAGGATLLAVGVFLVAPLLIVRVWRTARLPAGPLRDDLERMCRMLGISCRDILVWKTGGVITNAAVIGMLGRLRYVLLSDALLERMDAAQVRPIFGHEAGHILSHHILYSAVFAIATALICGTAGDLATRWGPPWLGETVALLSLAAAWALGFGRMSRRLERQSDVIGAWAVSRWSEGLPADDCVSHEGAAAFAWSLRRVAELNAIPLGQRNWRHGSIAARIEYILWLGSTGGSRRPIDRLVRRIKIGLWVLLAMGAAIAAASALWMPAA